MKKIILRLFTLFIAAVMMSACGQTEKAKSDKISVVCTIFPQYDWVRQILGDRSADTDLTLLLNSGIDLHSYQPSVEDIVKISSCDMLVYVGGESDAWVEDALKTSANKDMVVVNLMDTLGDTVKNEEIKVGMEHDHDHGELNPDNVKDRPLSDWRGVWTTIEQTLESGSLDKYISHQAEENGVDFDTQKSNYTQRWMSDYKSLEITDKSITIDDNTANYDYIGYEIVEGGHGASVWYGFKAETTAQEIPAYIAFSDHGTGNEDQETAHFHLRYGNESFTSLLSIENWAPTYFPSDATGEEIAEAMGGHVHSDESEPDEHVWLSLKNATTLCTHIAEKLCVIDPSNEKVYRENAKAYNEKLMALDSKYKETVSDAVQKNLLFGDRFPFRYLVDDYGLDYFAAFPGCSAETEASFDTVIFLANKVNELGLNTVMVTESSDRSIAKTIIDNTASKNQQVLVMNSMQSVTTTDIEKGTTYLSIMESNLNTLIDALK